MRAYQVPHGVPGLRVEAGGQLVGEHDLGVVDQRQRDEQSLLLTAGELAEHGVALLGEPQLLEQLPPVAPSTGRATQTDRAPPRPSCAPGGPTAGVGLRCAARDPVRVARGPGRGREILPRSGRRRPSTHSMVVVLPAPFGPTMPKISPGRPRTRCRRRRLLLHMTCEDALLV